MYRILYFDCKSSGKSSESTKNISFFCNFAHDFLYFCILQRYDNEKDHIQQV